MQKPEPMLVVLIAVTAMAALANVVEVRRVESLRGDDVVFAMQCKVGTHSLDIAYSSRPVE